ASTSGRAGGPTPRSAVPATPWPGRARRNLIRRRLRPPEPPPGPTPPAGAGPLVASVGGLLRRGRLSGLRTGRDGLGRASARSRGGPVRGVQPVVAPPRGEGARLAQL